MSEWAEMRHLHEVEGVSKRELARQFGRDVKTVRRALAKAAAPVRRTPMRERALDAHRDRVVALLKAEPKLTAKRVWVLLGASGVVVAERTARKFVASLRRELSPRQAFVHRTHVPGRSMEVDFGKSWARVGGSVVRVHFAVSALPFSNAYFSKAYAEERLEHWTDGVGSGLRGAGGLVERIVLDNTKVAVKRVLLGRDRVETRDFAAYRGALGLGVEYCAPRKGWEKGSVEAGVKYVRGAFFRPMPVAESWEDLNAQLARTLDADLDRRRLPDGRTAREALEEERQRLRPLPERWPESCRVVTRVADKYGHVRHDRGVYSVPIAHAYRPVVVKCFHDHLDLVVGTELVASHARVYTRGELSLDPLHVLPLLAQKARAADDATALGAGRVPAVFEQLRALLCERVGQRKATREWVEVLQLAAERGWAELAAAVELAIEQGSPRLATVARLLHVVPAVPAVVPAVPALDEALAAVTVAAPCLVAYDALGEAAA